MIALDWYFLCLFDLIDAFEDGQAVADTCNSHLLQIIVKQSNKCLANDFVF